MSSQRETCTHMCDLLFVHHSLGCAEVQLFQRVPTKKFDSFSDRNHLVKGRWKNRIITMIERDLQLKLQMKPLEFLPSGC